MHQDTVRAAGLRRSLRLEYLTVGWNVVEAVVAVAAAIIAGSSALLAFGGDSVIESASGAVLIWRLVAEGRATDPERVERVEQRAASRRLDLISPERSRVREIALDARFAGSQTVRRPVVEDRRPDVALLQERVREVVVQPPVLDAVLEELLKPCGRLVERPLGAARVAVPDEGQSISL